MRRVDGECLLPQWLLCQSSGPGAESVKKVTTWALFLEATYPALRPERIISLNLHLR